MSQILNKIIDADKIILQAKKKKKKNRSKKTKNKTI